MMFPKTDQCHLVRVLLCAFVARSRWEWAKSQAVKSRGRQTPPSKEELDQNSFAPASRPARSVFFQSPPAPSDRQDPWIQLGARRSVYKKPPPLFHISNDKLRTEILLPFPP